MSRRLATITKWINENLSELRATIEPWTSSTDRQIPGTRFRHAGKGRKGYRLQVYLREGGVKDKIGLPRAIFDHNSGETYRSNDEVERWLADYIKSRNVPAPKVEDAPRIVNTWDQLKAAVAAKLIPKQHALAISYTAPARTHVMSGVHVWSPFFHTDPAAAWYHYKRKAFGSERVSGTAEAIAWVAKTYKYDGAWTGNRMREQIPAIVQKMFPITRSPKP